MALCLAFDKNERGKLYGVQNDKLVAVSRHSAAPNVHFVVLACLTVVNLVFAVFNRSTSSCYRRGGQSFFGFCH